MPSSHGYIPANDGQFLEWARNLYQYALQNFQKWSVPSPQMSLQAPLGDFETAYEKLAGPNHGKVDTERKKEARNAEQRPKRGNIRLVRAEFNIDKEVNYGLFTMRSKTGRRSFFLFTMRRKGKQECF
jgi:hypothetical protein